MPKSPVTKKDAPTIAHQNDISRRTLLHSAATLAVHAAAAPVLHHLAINTALAQVAENSKFAQVFNPYAAATNTGPSSLTIPATTTTPAIPGSTYIVPTAPKWSSTSLLTTGNIINGYAMPGTPDGLGAFDNGDGTITILITHELEAGHGDTRGHGQRGAFVSVWKLNISTLQMLSGSDLVTSPTNFFARAPKDKLPAASLDIHRLCSADLAPISAYYNAASKKGYNGHILLNGEEGEHQVNRAFAWIVTDRAVYELPAFATGDRHTPNDQPPAWENLLANPATGDTTLVMANSDGGENRIYAYIGTKQSTGTPIDKAGLTNGKLYSLRIDGITQEKRDGNFGFNKSLLGQGNSKSVSLVGSGQGTAFNRPEDGAWDPRNPNVYYFATTDRNNFASPNSVRNGKDANQIGRARLWAVTFDDVTRIKTDGSPTAKIQMLLDGTEGGDMFDNITVDRLGIIYLCEDTGEERHNPKIWAYDTSSGALTQIMMFDPQKFGNVVNKKYTPPTHPFVDDKESSGILDVTDLFANAQWFRTGSRALLVAAQSYVNSAPKNSKKQDLSDGGQLLLLIQAP